MDKDYFSHKASEYDHSERRVNNVDRIAHAIRDQVRLLPDMHILDFGSGTGLLLQRIAPLVGRVTAVDISRSMNEQLERKRKELPCELTIREVDLAHEPLLEKFDGVISSMTLHHIRDIRGVFSRFHEMLKPDGFIALADLDREDGTFHDEDTGVHHLGFDRGWIREQATNAGFGKVRTIDASSICKESREYPVFLLTGVKSDAD